MDEKTKPPESRVKHILKLRLADSPSLEAAKKVIAQFYMRSTDSDVTLTPKCEGAWFVDMARTGRMSALVVRCGTKHRPFVFGSFSEAA